MKTVKLERDTRLTHDCVGEFTIPDYLPAVEKLLSAECSLTPDGIYLRSSGGTLTAELGGEAAFCIIWQGDEDGAVTGATFRCDYESAVALGTLSDAAPRCRAATNVESVFCRVTGPRKLSLRARLSSKVTVMSESSPDIPPECASDSVETLKTELPSAIPISGESRDLFATVGPMLEASPLYCRGGVRVDSCSPASPSELRLSGEVLLSCFFASDGVISTETAAIPFDELITLELPTDVDLSSTLSCRGYGRVASVFLREGETGYTAEVTYELFAEAMISSPVMCIRDAFAVSLPSSATYRELDYTLAVACASTNVTVNEKAAASRVGKVEVLTCNAEVESAVADRGRLKLSGSLTGTALIHDGGERENVPYNVPWVCELPALSSASDSPDLSADVSVLSAVGRADGELTVTAELAVSASAFARERISVLDSLSVGDASGESPHAIHVCYPRDGESAWEIAKRYRVPVSRVEASGLTDGGVVVV